MGLTRKRNLRDGNAVWTAYAVPAIAGARQPRSLRTEVLVVGAGISGAMIAQSLAEAGKRLVIVDRRRAALLGSTAASTALLQFELDTPLTQLGAVIGRRKTAKVWIASRDAVNELRTRSHRLGIFATPSKPGRAFTHLTTLSKSNATAEVPLCTRVMAFASTLGWFMSALSFTI